MFRTQAESAALAGKGRAIIDAFDQTSARAISLDLAAFLWGPAQPISLGRFFAWMGDSTSVAGNLTAVASKVS